MTKTLLSLGHGYTAQALATRLLPQGWTILGTYRDPAQEAELRAQGITPLQWPIDFETALKDVTHVLTSIRPDKDGDPVLRLGNDALQKAAPNLEWLGYLSTTGVYGDMDGDWVDEDTPLDPGGHRGKMRVLAEAEWQALPDLPLHIFRLAGIYGPGRGPFAKLRNGTARRIIKKNQVFSRAHVDDIAQVLEASIKAPHAGQIYNVCDDTPAPPQDILAYAAELLGMAPPPEIPFEEAEMSPMARSFYSDSKRVRNNRIKAELGVVLKYPNYQDALKAMLQDETA
ncbi:SDR family oxidoreductase [Shimia sagamensis]|uniref:Nucleoside-diphosphate-sugar epimerase n=1 Tax=Shimia sagamensis TaxID=1566352 RepID=A0ABY1N9F2_9RHOB|nr:SDR family oxidoreductase [Shimia sagamensis]SMP04088.1 Nucleoside-diphosphate-sugar epimerase [Shimia sagamensis]